MRFYTLPHWYGKKHGPREKNLATYDEIETILESCNFGDYLFLTQLADNMEIFMFCEFIKYLFNYREENKVLREGRAEDEELSTADTETKSIIGKTYPELIDFNNMNDLENPHYASNVIV